MTVHIDGEERFCDETDADHDYRAAFEVEEREVEVDVA